jgi:dihydropyrimidinase
MIHEFGVRQGRISTNPAKYFGLFSRKGTIAVGSDADLVVFDPDKKVTISAAGHHSRCDYNLYEGTEVTGSPEIVLLRGKVIVDGDEFLGRAGEGQFVKRARFGELLSAVGAAAAG